MGISGFLPLLKSIHESVHLSSFAGKTVAVDGNVWMHRGAFTCAVDLATNVSTTKYVDYFMRQVEMLLCYKIIPLIVFDGEPLPIKACTNDERRRRREEALEKGRLLMQQGNKKEAYEYFCKSVQVTRDMVKQVIAALEARNIQNVVAPYEADPQLAYLMKTKKADAVITEDSDLLVFGCDCVIFKLNKYGEGVQIRLSNLNRLKEMKLGDWDATKIRHMCILSGCDYLPSLPGVGLKTAYQLLKTYKSADQVIKVLRSQGKMKKIPHYQEAFHRADQAFMYPFVFDLDLQQVVRLNPLESKDITLDFLGAHPSNVKLPTSTPPLPCNDVSDANKENIPVSFLIN
ncbi:PIN domain-like protein [Radiomyces spectabilis]|uniref:PIN domain-like protein n=1 Tax=Radiomyces spectabilis TaxID=64574 RepID=UPI00222010CF|nr:PIN domain-like protein [Radiomyces spectabilis]KAI8376386.1 PIN domain-like protein [Radiomyces spectabilis]